MTKQIIWPEVRAALWRNRIRETFHHESPGHSAAEDRALIAVAIQVDAKRLRAARRTVAAINMHSGDWSVFA